MAGLGLEKHDTVTTRDDFGGVSALRSTEVMKRSISWRRPWES